MDRGGPALVPELPATTPYSQGLCRIYRGEVLALRGDWDEAEAELRQAHDELLPHKPGGAAEASYAVGELLRRRGDLAAAERAFVSAQRLGWDPSPAWPCCGWPRAGWAPPRPRFCLDPGLAAAGRPVRPRPPPGRPGRRVDRGRRPRPGPSRGRGARRRRGRDGQPLISATAATAAGALRLAEGDLAAALERLRHALGRWRDLGLPYEEARARLLAGAAVALLGDAGGGRVELEAARAASNGWRRRRRPPGRRSSRPPPARAAC